MTILDTITAYKKQEVSARSKAFPVSVLERSLLFERACFSMANALQHSSSGIIAEHKRRSPSKSVINDTVLLPEVVQGYESAGVAALSVLTDTQFFGGSLDDLLMARAHVSLPILRKEFIVDTYQIFEAKAYGADAVLLIAASLSVQELKEFSALAKQLGMDVLLEVHNSEELQKSLLPHVDMLGVNNRNLKTFEVSLDVSKELSKQIPSNYLRVSESGIGSVEAIKELRSYGYEGFLMGEHFMKQEDPGRSAKTFIQQLS